MNILLIEWGAYTENDISTIANAMGISVKKMCHHFVDKNNDEEFEESYLSEDFINEINGLGYECTTRLSEDISKEDSISIQKEYLCSLNTN